MVASGKKLSVVSHQSRRFVASVGGLAAARGRGNSPGNSDPVRHLRASRRRRTLDRFFPVASAHPPRANAAVGAFATQIVTIRCRSQGDRSRLRPAWIRPVVCWCASAPRPLLSPSTRVPDRPRYAGRETCLQVVRSLLPGALLQAEDPRGVPIPITPPAHSLCATQGGWANKI